MRIRSIKPEFWSSEDIGGLAWDERLLFIGLWSYVADSGVGRDNAKLITADLFPLEDDPITTLATVTRGLASLSAAGLITRYSVKGKRFLHIIEWSAHQKIDRPTRSPFPSPTSELAILDESSCNPREGSLPGARDLGNKGAREQGSKGLVVAASAPVIDHAGEFAEFWDLYPRKVAKPKALTAFKAARKRASTDTIIDGLIRLLPSLLAGEERFCPHASTWLNADRWNDPIPSVTTKPTRQQQTDDLFDRALARGQR